MVLARFFLGPLAACGACALPTISPSPPARPAAVHRGLQQSCDEDASGALTAAGYDCASSLAVVSKIGGCEFDMGGAGLPGLGWGTLLSDVCPVTCGVSTCQPETHSGAFVSADGAFKEEYYCDPDIFAKGEDRVCARRSSWGHVPPTDEARSAAAIEQLDDDVRTILAGLTLEQKIGQMVQLNIDEILASDWRSDPASPRIDLEKLRRVARAPYFVGSFLNSPFSGAGGLPGRDGESYSSMSAEMFRTMVTTIQQTIMEEGGSGIPMVYGLDSVHGANYVREGTLFPQQINQAATFNREATQQAASVAAKDTKAAGVPWLFAPILGVATKPAWSRVYETFGEDPLLAAELGVAVVRGMQGGPDGTAQLSDPESAAACLKHFIGYPNQDISHDRTPNTIPERQLMEYFVPPFRAAIKAGAATMMAAYGSINGVPVTGSRAIMTELLRDELNFTGMIVTDWGEINNLAGYHRVAENEYDAAEISMRETTIDMSMVPSSLSFSDNLRDLVAQGKVSEGRVNIAAGRVLQLKKDLGLIADPYLSSSAQNSIGASEDRALSRDIASESLVLLKNSEAAGSTSGGWHFADSIHNWAAAYWPSTHISEPSEPPAISWNLNQQQHELPLQVNWGDEGPATGNPANRIDEFTVRFTGTVVFTQEGFWRFTEHSDDLGDLTIDGEAVIAPYRGNGGNSLDSKSATIHVGPGAHELVYTFVEQGGAAYASLEWEMVPTGSEGWNFVNEDGWQVSYRNFGDPALDASFQYKDGVCSGTNAPNCSNVCSQKQYGQQEGYLPLNCDFRDTGVFSERTAADASDVNPYPSSPPNQWTIDYTTTIVTAEEQSWQFLASASDDVVSLTIDGEQVWAVEPGNRHECVDIYDLPVDDPCNLGVTDAVDNLLLNHEEWYVVNNVQYTREMGREVMHRHLHYRNVLGLDGGQACPQGPCAAGSQCSSWDLHYTDAMDDPLHEGSCSPESIVRLLQAGQHTIVFSLTASAHRNHLSLSWRPNVVHKPILPLDPGKKVLLVGPSMDSLARLAGGWTLHWQGASDDSEFPAEYHQQTLKQAFEGSYDRGTSGSVNYLNPVDIYGKEAGVGAIDEALTATADADVVIIAFGEHVYTEKPGDIDDLALPTELTAFVEDIVAVGTPSVAVLIEGRPRLLNGCLDSATAVIWAGLPGPEGGPAIADALMGTTSPSGRMPISYPRSALNAPYPYWHYVDSVCSYSSGQGNCHVEWSFGHGLNYAAIEYSDLTLSSDTVTGCEEVTAQVTVINTDAERTQKHSVLLFMRDEVRSVTPEDKRLRGFEKLTLAPGERQVVTFTLGHADYTYYGIDISRGPVAEPGRFTVLTGPQPDNMLVAGFNLVRPPEFGH